MDKVLEYSQDSTVNKLKLLFLLDKMEIPLTENNIIDICTSRNNWINYMDCKEILWQLLVFVVISVISLFATLPLVNKIKKKEHIVPTNLDRVIGKEAEVIKEIRPNHFGEVEIFGSTWTAVSRDEIKVGEKVIVEKIDGVKLIVKKEEKK